MSANVDYLDGYTDGAMVFLFPFARKSLRAESVRQSQKVFVC